MKKIKLLITLSAICTSSLIYAQDHLAPSTMKNPVADIHPDNSYLLEEALVYLKIGNKKVVEKDFHAAAENYTKALEIKHNFKEALKNRGICYTMMNMDEKAIQDFDHAIIIDPDDKSLYSYRGFAKAEAKQFEEALKDLNIAISMDNKFSDAYMNKGIVYIWMGNFEAAIKEFDKIISFDPENGKAYYNRGIAYEELENIPRACIDWQKSLNLKYRLALEMVGTYCQ